MSSPLRRLAPGPSAVVGVSAVLLLLDASVVSRSYVGLTLMTTGVLALGASAAYPRVHRAGRVALACGIALVTALVSLLTTSLVRETVLQRTPGWGELGGLLLLLCLVCRYAPPAPLVIAVVPLLIAVALTKERAPVLMDLPVIRDIDGLFVLLPLAFTALGGYLRSEDVRRRSVARDIRHAERLDLARDLHDHVAHYVTAIVVQAQAGDQVAERDPATARQLFGNIERTGQDGLVAMGRMVKLLRTDDQSAAEATVTPVLTSIAELVQRADSVSQRTSLEVAGDMNDSDWPPQLAKTVQRLVQEGLTNVRKHARAATAVQVKLGVEEGRLIVRVRDDATGQNKGRPWFRPSGFGMTGLAERVAELGGELSSGPMPEGGWELAASLPVQGADGRSR